ncbi:hypothetical protein NDU88_001942 [Pleurodeles waltl]|uniref:Uncharacterized protein n=1 Tax=Pleurodeles waltl TaxID=8319 RepID=A0AAV7LEP7_PLEWA|nr:hypothetical protein NDU88_001942 [Pleurodeles waltl]
MCECSAPLGPCRYPFHIAPSGVEECRRLQGRKKGTNERAMMQIRTAESELRELGDWVLQPQLVRRPLRPACPCRRRLGHDGLVRPRGLESAPTAKEIAAVAALGAPVPVKTHRGSEAGPSLIKTRDDNSPERVGTRRKRSRTGPSCTGDSR